MRAVHLATLTAAALAISSCRTVQGESGLTADGTINSRVVLVYMGGFNSCGSGGSPLKLAAYPLFQTLAAALTAAGHEVAHVASCYNGLSSSMIKWTSSGSSTIYSQPWREPAAPGQLFDEVRTLSNGFAQPIFVVGHSYGGWLAANFVANVATVAPDRAGAVRALFTIDPISPYHCDQVAYAATLAKAQGIPVGNAAAAGCSSAPAQFRAQDGATYPAAIVNDGDGKFRGLIKTAARRWTNWYQTKDYLHSSAIDPDADGFPANVHVAYSGTIFGSGGTPHLKIHKAPDVWSAITEAVLQVAPEAGPLPASAFAAPSLAPAEELAPFQQQIQRAIDKRAEQGQVPDAQLGEIYGDGVVPAPKP